MNLKVRKIGTNAFLLAMGILIMYVIVDRITKDSRRKKQMKDIEEAENGNIDIKGHIEDLENHMYSFFPIPTTSDFRAWVNLWQVFPTDALRSIYNYFMTTKQENIFQKVFDDWLFGSWTIPQYSEIKERLRNEGFIN